MACYVHVAFTILVTAPVVVGTQTPSVKFSLDDFDWALLAWASWIGNTGLKQV